MGLLLLCVDNETNQILQNNLRSIATVTTTRNVNVTMINNSIFKIFSSNYLQRLKSDSSNNYYQMMKSTSNINDSRNERQLTYTTNPDGIRVVVSLTTTPKRLKMLKPTIDSLLAQSVLPDMIQLNLPFIFRRTNHTYEENLTTKYPWLSHDRIRIVRCNDVGPSTKLVPTLANETDPNTLIVIIDDDTTYSGMMIEAMSYGASVIKDVDYILVTRCGDWWYIHPSSAIKATQPLPEIAKKLYGCCCMVYEAYGSVGYRRGLFDNFVKVNGTLLSFNEYMAIALRNPKCFRSDDWIISNFFALLNIQGIMLDGYIKYKQLSHGFEKGADGALWALEPTGHPYRECMNYLVAQNMSGLNISANIT